MTKKEVMEQEKSEDFNSDLKINKYRLDEECLSHSTRYAYYSEAQAVSKSNISKQKDNLELVTAEANIRIRKEKSESGEKVTESLIASYLTMDKEVQKAKSELREAEEVYARLSVAVSAMETRRSELDNLVKLYCAGYFSTVNSDGNMKKNVNEQTSSDIRKNLNKE